MKLEIGSKISWKCSLGNLNGKVDQIVLDLNAANQIVPWIVIGLEGTKSKIRLCGTDSNLKMMKVSII
jgi:hypothetical protein